MRADKTINGLLVSIVDTETDEVIGTIPPDGTVPADLVAGRAVTLLVETDDPDLADAIGSVRMTFDGHTQVENFVPYALFGDARGDFRPGRDLATGDYDLRIEVFAESGARGAVLREAALTVAVAEAGDPLIELDATDDVTADEPAEPETILGTSAAENIVGGAGDEFIKGRGGADTLDGGAGDDTVNGGEQNDLAFGGAGNDKLWTNKGEDTLDGGAGDDRVWGGDGDDIVRGGDGNDTVGGGEGRDTLAFDLDDGTDNIYKFVPGEDQIAFEGVNASFADLSIVTEGNRAVIRLGETELRLGGLTAEDLSAEDFLFPDATPVVAADPDAIVLPDGATVIDVTEYGVIADDGIDDTSAIQQMVNAVGRGTYYFADGTYDISDTILLPSGQGTNVPSFMTFQGESEDGTIFKLADGLDHQGPIIGSTGSVAQAFNNRFRDMTFDIGTGNTQADGLQFAGNNQSTVKDVTIRSGEGGRIGLDLVSQSELGPALIEDVTVEGFETGIATAFQGNSVTLEDITLRGQDVGISSTDAHVAFLRGIDYEGPGTGVANRFVSHMVLTDSTFTSTDPGIENQSAVTSAWSLYGRNIEAEGFDTTINTAAQGFISNEDTIAEDIEEYIYFGNYERLRGGSFELFEGSAETGLDLEVRETPETVWNVDVGTWVDVRDFGAVEGQDATAAFQAAIDSGATTVYVPDGTWQLDGEVVIRGAVEQVLSSGLARVSEGAQLRIADGTSDQVIIEGLNNEGSLKEWDIVHDSGRTVVLRDIVGFNYEAVSEGDQGDVFLANVVGGQTIFRDQDVWARQLNLEGDSVAKGHEAKVINDGANVWILGLKTEGLGTTVKTVNDGQTELLGSFHNGSVDFDIPRFITEDASFWTTIVDGSTFSQDFELVRETRDGVTREGRMTSDNIRPDVYSAFDPAVIADRVIIVDNDEATATGAWQSATSFPGNFLGGDFLFAAGGSDAAIDYAATAVATGRYDVSIRFIEERGGQPSSGHADAVDVEFGVADDVFTFADLDMKDATERWQDLGVIDVAAGEEMFVRFDAEGVDGNVIADAVRFERIVEETGQDDLLV